MDPGSRDEKASLGRDDAKRRHAQSRSPFMSL
jgi:hypothetical protein